MRQFAAMLVLAGLAGSPLMAQEADEHDEHEALKHHRVSLFTGYTFVPQADHHGNAAGVVVVPTIGIDYAYAISHRFSLGVLNAFELSTYVVERDDGSSLTREFVYVGAVVAMWQAVPNLTLLAGPGWELKTHENFFVVKVGAEYEFPLPGHWDLSIPLHIDFKEDVYNALSIGLAVGKRF